MSQALLVVCAGGNLGQVCVSTAEQTFCSPSTFLIAGAQTRCRCLLLLGTQFDDGRAG
jgi:hypothetical protein